MDGSVSSADIALPKPKPSKLRRNRKCVARGIPHIQNRALDFRLPGIDTAVLRDTARRMKRGGVGYYQKSDFIQIDTGRVRNR